MISHPGRLLQFLFNINVPVIILWAAWIDNSGTQLVTDTGEELIFNG